MRMALKIVHCGMKIANTQNQQMVIEHILEICWRKRLFGGSFSEDREATLGKLNYEGQHHSYYIIIQPDDIKAVIRSWDEQEKWVRAFLHRETNTAEGDWLG